MTKITSYQLSQEHGMLSIEEIDFIKEHVALLPKNGLVRLKSCYTARCYRASH